MTFKNYSEKIQNYEREARTESEASYKGEAITLAKDAVWL